MPLAIAASMNSRRRSASVWPRTMRAMVSQPTAPMAMNSAARLPRGNSVDEDDDDEDVRQRVHDVDEAHHRRVDAPAHEARERAPRDADAHAHQGGEQPQRQRHAQRLHAAGEQVAPQPVGAEPVRGLELRRHGQVLPVERGVAPG